MKFKLIENIEHDVQETVLAEGITLNEDINDGTVRLDSKIESGIDGSHIEAVILDPIEGTTSFVGHYIDGESVGNKFTFIYANEEGKEFVNRNGFDELGPTEILTVDGEDKGAYYIFDENELKNIKTDSTPITEDVDVRKYTNKLLGLVEEGIVDATKCLTNLLQWISEEEVAKFCSEYEYFTLDESVIAEAKKTYKPHTMRLLKLIGSDLINECAEQPLTEGDSITEATNKWEYEVYADSNSMDEDEFFDDLKSAKKFAIELATKLKELDPGANVIIKRGLKGDSKPDEWDIITRVKSKNGNNLTEAVAEVDLVLNDDEVMDLDEKTGDITIYDDVIDYTPELPIVFKFAEDEDNLVHKYIMKDHDEEAGTIRLAYDGPDELTEELLMEGPFKAIKNAVANHKADKATKKALEMDNKPDAKNWTYIVDGKSMNYSQYKELDDKTRANAIVLDKGFYIRRGTEDLSDRLIRYTKDNADTSGHEYSNKADRKAAAADQKAADKEQRAQEKADTKEQKAQEKADAQVEKTLNKIDLRDYQFMLDGEPVAYGDYIAMNDEKKSRVTAINKKGEQLDSETLATVTQRYMDRKAQKDTDKEIAAAQAEENQKAKDLDKAENDTAKATIKANKDTFNKAKNTIATNRRTSIAPKGTLTFYPADKSGKTADTTQASISAKDYAKLPSTEQAKYIAVDSKGSQFTRQMLLNFKRKAKKLKMESLDDETGDILEEAMIFEELFLDDEEEILDESLNLIPGDEAMAGWIDNMSDDQIDAEVTNIQQIATKLKVPRPEDLVILVDTEMYYDPASYHFVPVETTRLGSKRYEIEGIDLFVDARNGNYYLYFTSEEAANRYAKIIDDENDLM